MQSTPGLTKARGTLARLVAEAQCLQELTAAVKANNVSLLHASIGKAREMGLTDNPNFAAAEKAMSKFAAQVPCCCRLCAVACCCRCCAVMV